MLSKLIEEDYDLLYENKTKNTDLSLSFKKIITN